MKRRLVQGNLFLIVGLGAFSLGQGCASSPAFSDPSISLSGLETEVKTFDNSFDETQIPDQWQDYGMGDPFVFRFNGTYYVYPSTRYDQAGIRAWKSQDLMSWEPCTGQGLPTGYVLSPEYDTETLGAYAPEVTYRDGTFFLCESQAGTGHYFFSAPTPEGPFVPITGNEGNSIDGDFFLDQDESLYFLRAQDSEIRMHKLNDDFSFSTSAINVEAASMGGWTEGPFMLLRDGIYYLTFTGVHVGSAGYKVGYAAMAGSDTAFMKNGYYRGGNVLISTDDDWNTLGHSSTVLGPDLDSYYLAYHSRSAGKAGRQFNLSRLLFSGTKMAVDRASLTGTVVPSLAGFRTYDPETDLDTLDSFRLSPSSTLTDFTGEWNFQGEGTKCVFSFVNEDHYRYLLMKKASLEIHQVDSGGDLVVYEIPLNRTYSLDVLHTLRLSLRKGEADLYFDGMEKGYRLVLPSEAGKIGYLGQNLKMGFTAISAFSLGSSEQSYPKQRHFFAESYDPDVSQLSHSLVSTGGAIGGEGVESGEKILSLARGDYAAYKIDVEESGLYSLSLRLGADSLGKTLGLKIDDEPLTKVTLSSSDDSAPLFSLEAGEMTLSQGEHYLTLVSDGDLVLAEGDFEKTEVPVSLTSDLTAVSDAIVLRGSGMSYQSGGLASTEAERAIAFLDRKGYQDCSVSVSLTFLKDTSVHSAGLVLRAKNDAYSQWDDDNSLQGYYLGIKNSLAFVKRCDYQALTAQLAIDSGSFASGVTHLLKATISGISITMSLDGVTLFSLEDPDGLFGGRVGLYSDGAAVLFSALTVTPIEGEKA